MNSITESGDVFPFFDFIKADEIKSCIVGMESHHESESVFSTLTMEEDQEEILLFQRGKGWYIKKQ